MNPPHEIETRLRTAKRQAQPPTDLHQNIMEAVQRSRSQPRVTEPTAQRGRLGWVALVVLIAGLGLFARNSGNNGGLRSVKKPDAAAAFAGVGPLIGHSQGLLSKAPDIALEPLSQELMSVKQDLTNFVEYLVAAVR